LADGEGVGGCCFAGGAAAGLSRDATCGAAGGVVCSDVAADRLVSAAGRDIKYAPATRTNSAMTRIHHSRSRSRNEIHMVASD
jgi:hypothetical protein